MTDQPITPSARDSLPPASERPELDPARLQEIADLDLVREEADSVLQQLVVDVAQAMNLPIAMVTVILDEAQFNAATHNVTGWVAEAQGMPIEWSFCANSVRTREAFVFENGATDPRVKDNPLVTVEGVRCYAGVPLISSRGYVLGNLCVVGAEERSFSEKDIATLRSFTERAVAHIETRRRPA